MKNRSHRLLLLTSVLAFGHAWGDEPTDPIAANSTSVSLAFGYGQFASPIAQHDRLEVYLLPQFAWYGERAYFDNGLLGFALQESPRFQADLVVYPGPDGLLFHLSRTTAPFLGGASTHPIEDHISVIKTPERRIAPMAGVRLAGSWAAGQWSVLAGHDVGAVHNGAEIALRWSQPALWQSDHWQLGGELGTTWKSAELVDYYYTPEYGEIMPAEGEDYLPDPDRWAKVGPYPGKHGFSSHAQLQLRYTVSAHWSLLIWHRQHWLSAALSDSPIVTRNQYGAGFAGIEYRF